MSLIELLAACGILSLLMLGSAELILNQQKAQKVLMMNMDYIDLVTSVQGIIANPDVCKNTFYDSNGKILTLDATDVTNTSKDVAEIKSSTISLAKLNQTLGGAQTVTQLKLTNITSTGANTYSATPVIQLTRSANIGASVVKTKIFSPIYLTTSAGPTPEAGTIIGCSTGGIDLAGGGLKVCTRATSYYEDFTFNSGGIKKQDLAPFFFTK
jgi:hypothetical protein